MMSIGFCWKTDGEFGAELCNRSIYALSHLLSIQRKNLKENTLD